MTNLFTTEHGAVTSGANKLNITASLTNVASGIASVVIERLLEHVENVDTKEAYTKLFEDSKVDNDVLDSMIDQFTDLNVVNIDFLKEESEDTLDRALKSQQSKRSRTKTKPMTADNYKQLVTAAVSENLIRLALDKPKGTGGAVSGGSSSLTEEEIKRLTGDVAAINKAIRNVQSKKSIAKSKLDFDETSERYQSFLAIEKQLKQMRAEANGVQSTEATEALEKQEKLKELLVNVNSKDLKLGEARSMIDQIQELIKDDEVESTDEAESVETTVETEGEDASE